MESGRPSRVAPGMKRERSARVSRWTWEGGYLFTPWARALSPRGLTWRFQRKGKTRNPNALRDVAKDNAQQRKMPQNRGVLNRRGLRSVLPARSRNPIMAKQISLLTDLRQAHGAALLLPDGRFSPGLLALARRFLGVLADQLHMSHRHLVNAVQIIEIPFELAENFAQGMVGPQVLRPISASGGSPPRVSESAGPSQ